MTSRLCPYTQIIAENAGMGKFPSLDPIRVVPARNMVLQKKLQAIVQWEKKNHSEILASTKSKDDRKG